MFVRIGLTGGIASGKSTVAAHLRELGAMIIDYDVLAARVVAPGGVGLRRVVEAFGPQALAADGSLNRQWMAGQVFGPHCDPHARARLDAIEHPLIYAMASQLEEEYRRTVGVDEGGSGTGGDDGHRPRHVVVHDVPLLTEVIDTIPFHFDHVVTVEAPRAMRIARMVDTRGMSREAAQERIRHQPNRGERLRVADTVIDSTQPIERMFETVDKLYQLWTGRAVEPVNRVERDRSAR